MTTNQPEYGQVVLAANALRERVESLHEQMEVETRKRDERIRWTHRAVAASALVGLIGVTVAVAGWALNGRRVDDIIEARTESRRAYCRSLDAVATVQTEIDQILQVSIGAPRVRTPEEQVRFDQFVRLVEAQKQSVAAALAAARTPSCPGGNR